ncbi:UNVERIFIED_CONTAM: hypothetical protein Sradi_2941400 [Sesamum radiatum]|uniref:Uncharacterized protein n=1 Tax=Sesamum radiatum TaxID=300843 RepID=A0AAW2S159_SESRA
MLVVPRSQVHSRTSTWVTRRSWRAGGAACSATYYATALDAACVEASSIMIEDASTQASSRAVA